MPIQEFSVNTKEYPAEYEILAVNDRHHNIRHTNKKKNPTKKVFLFLSFFICSNVT